MNEQLDTPLIIIIFGISGDLSQRKLLPALYHLMKRDELPSDLRIVGVSRRNIEVASVYENLHERIAEDDLDSETLSRLQASTEMFQLDTESKEAYAAFKEHLRNVSDKLGDGVSRIYYLSIPAQAFMTAVHYLGETGHHEPFASDSERPRILIEKPFGYDTHSAKELVSVVDEHFGELQAYRIDHYLAKETAQNILTFRFRNPLFKSIWNAKHIEQIKIVAHESIGIENRVSFYEQTGALRDFIQSHLIQLLALVVMEEPDSFESHDIHAAKLRLLEDIKTISTDEVSAIALRGQYDSYRHEVGNKDSLTETFARLTLHVHNAQWRDIPMVLETGKGLRDKTSKILVTFKNEDPECGPNILTFRIQPREGITMSLQAKRPGLDKDTETVEMEFDYEKSYGNTTEAYERVIIDAIRADQSLFASADEVLSSWRIMENVLTSWQKNSHDLRIYPIGSPAEEIN